MSVSVRVYARLYVGWRRVAFTAEFRRRRRLDHDVRRRRRSHQLSRRPGFVLVVVVGGDLELHRLVRRTLLDVDVRSRRLPADRR